MVVVVSEKVGEGVAVSIGAGVVGGLVLPVIMGGMVRTGGTVVGCVVDGGNVEGGVVVGGSVVGGMVLAVGWEVGAIVALGFR